MSGLDSFISALRGSFPEGCGIEIGAGFAASIVADYDVLKAAAGAWTAIETGGCAPVIEAGEVVPKDMPVEYCLDAAGRYEAWARHPNRQGGLDEARNQILDLCCNTRSLVRQLARALAGVPATQPQPSGDSGQQPAEAVASYERPLSAFELRGL